MPIKHTYKSYKYTMTLNFHENSNNYIMYELYSVTLKLTILVYVFISYFLLIKSLKTFASIEFYQQRTTTNLETLRIC